MMMGAPDYSEYIASDAWRAKRDSALLIASRRSPRRGYPACEACGKFGGHFKNPSEHRVQYANGLHVHHVTYRNLGDEPPEDLIVLCTECHKRVHEDRAFRLAVEQIAGGRW
jgi:5-methylcytosine-specific restriction endonuclease McrA